MQCRICGDDDATFRNRSGMALCNACHGSTPSKVGRAEFDRVYWDADGGESVPESTRREFFDDYRASSHATVESYRDATTSYAM